MRKSHIFNPSWHACKRIILNSTVEIEAGNKSLWLMGFANMCTRLVTPCSAAADIAVLVGNTVEYKQEIDNTVPGKDMLIGLDAYVAC